MAQRRHALGAALTVLLTVVLVTVGFVVVPYGRAAAAPQTASDVVADVPIRVASATAPVGPPMVSSAAARHAAVRCFGDLADPARPVVLLIPGTGLTAEENWSPTYRPALRARGFATCQVQLPAYATRDLQVSAEYVATAIRDVHRASGRLISLVGLSQGALLPRVALKIWPSLALEVEDVIGLGGVYDAGSAGVNERCSTSCAPALQQMRSHAALLSALGRRPLPDGPSYSNVGTLADLTVTPQPSANEQRGSRSIQVQEVCPGRGESTNAHAYLAGDAVAFALVLDALVASGTGSADRIPTTVCDEQYYPEFDEETWTALAPVIGSRLNGKVGTEPAVRCYLDADCRDVDARGRLLSLSRKTVKGRKVVWTGQVVKAGTVRLRLAGRTVARRVSPGRVVLQMTVPRRARYLRVETMPSGYRVWGLESIHRVRGRG